MLIGLDRSPTTSTYPSRQARADLPSLQKDHRSHPTVTLARITADTNAPDEETLVVAQGRFALLRPQTGMRGKLRAWDGADEFLLNAIASPGDVGREPLPDHHLKILVLNDAFGALAVGLAEHQTTSAYDSLSARRTAGANLQTNRLEAQLISSVDPLPPAPDLVVIKIPRTLSLLEHQLHSVRAIASPATRIIAAGMVKRVRTSTLDLFARILGPTVTSHAKKKARLIFPTLDLDRSVEPNPWPARVMLDGTHPAVVHAGVFAGIALDIGTRALLANLPAVQPGSSVVDLGCGNGILGAVLAARKGVAVTFVDDSYLAVESARGTLGRTLPHGSAHFVVDDAGQSLADSAFDLVVNNPPFHHGDSLSGAVAKEMFVQARRILKPGGELRVVGNRHLGYHTNLNRLFGNCETVAGTPKFVVLSARKKTD